MEYLNKQTDMFLDLKSKTCNVCGYINQDLNLSIREWTCKSCNTTHNRDLLAANNILKFGLKKQNLIKFTAGTVG